MAIGVRLLLKPAGQFAHERLIVPTVRKKHIPD
jgi:hypothetical protein